MTRLLIIADMEGISGIEHYEQCNRYHPSYKDGVRLLCQEINEIADAALTNGATTVSVIDWHGGGGNLDRQLLDDRVDIVPEDLSPGYDLAMLVGFHPMAGDYQGFISHTMTQGVAVEVGGQQVGEIALLSWWLGDFGIPVGLVSGDRAATAEADRFSPEIPTHTVKQAESWSRSVCVPVEQSFTVLRQRVAHILTQRERWSIHQLPGPIDFRLRLRDDHPAVALIPWLIPDDEGWLAGQVDRPKDLIDLLDVIAALMSVTRLNSQIASLRDNPTVQELIQRYHLDTITVARERGHWDP